MEENFQAAPAVMLYSGDEIYAPEPQEPKSTLITTKTMSKWIGVLKAIMMVQIVCYHHDKANRYYTFIAWHIFTPHFLTYYGGACNYMFFIFASHFGLSHFIKLADEPAWRFTKLFAKQFVKRYVQLRATLLIMAIGYVPFLYFVFGEEGRGSMYDAVRSARFWKELLFPWFWYQRLASGCIYSGVSGAGWFSLDLMNQEAILYILYFVQHFLHKICKNDYVWGLSYIAGMLVISIPCMAVGVFSTYMAYACTGQVVCVLRVFMAKPRATEWLNRLYSRKHATIYRWVLCALCAYLWLVTGRLVKASPVSVLFMIIPLVLDLCPPFSLPYFLETVLNELNRLQMEVYLLHSPFLEQYTPRGLPQVATKDFNYMNPVTINWFMVWQYPLLFMELAYPLWFLTKPLTEFVDWVDDRIKKRPILWKQFWLSAASLACTTVVTTLQQAGVFGRGSCSLSDVYLHTFDWVK